MHVGANLCPSGADSDRLTSWPMLLRAAFQSDDEDAKQQGSLLDKKFARNAAHIENSETTDCIGTQIKSPKLAGLVSCLRSRLTLPSRSRSEGHSAVGCSHSSR